MQTARVNPNGIHERRKEKEVVGRATVEIRPTKHFGQRFAQRISDLLPYIDPRTKFGISGILVRTRDPEWYYLDVGGVGRLVLKWDGSEFLGVTVLPQVHCHAAFRAAPGVADTGREVPA
jgi:hypothetical protein